MSTATVDWMTAASRVSLVSFYALGLLLLTPGRPMADASTGHCEVYGSQMASKSPGIAALLSKHQDVAAKICWGSGKTVERYYSLSRVWIDSLGVCQFQETEKDVALKANARSTRFMLPSRSGNCPSQASAEYIRTDNITPGTFAALVRFWDDLGRSRENFDRGFSELKALDRQTPAFKLAERTFLERRKPFPLRRIALIPSFPGVSSVGYELQGPTVNSGSITLYVDLTKNGFRIFSIGLMIE